MTGALLRLQTVSFSDLAWEALLPFESVAFEAGVALDSRITPDLELLGDPEQLRRLVAILVDNAVKYAGPRGSASLILRPQGDEAVLSVHNTGEPIPPEHLPRLFERFYRTDSDRARSQGATVWGCPSPRASQTAIGAGSPSPAPPSPAPSSPSGCPCPAAAWVTSGPAPWGEWPAVSAW